MRNKEFSEAVEHFQLSICVWQDLAQEGVNVHIALQLLAKLFPILLRLDGFEPINRRLEMALHVGMVCRSLLCDWLVENP